VSPSLVIPHTLKFWGKNFATIASLINTETRHEMATSKPLFHILNVIIIVASAKRGFVHSPGQQ
jgi:hypothetical protein